MNRIHAASVLVGAAASLGATGTVAAQSANEELLLVEREVEPDEDGGFGIDDLSAGIQWLLPADIENGTGDVERVRYGAEISFEYELESGIELSLGGEYLREDWSYGGGGIGLLPGVAQPWDGFERYGFEVGFAAPVGNWELFGEFGVEWAEETNASTSDSSLIEGFIAGRTALRDNFDLVLGVYYGESFEDGDDILPLIGFDWRITDFDRLTLDRPRQGYELGYRRTLSDEWTFLGYGRFVTDEFRLGSGGPASNGALSTEAFEIGVGLEYELGPGRAGISVGYTLGTEYEIFDSSGNTIAEPELDSGLTVGVFYRVGF